MNLHRQSKGARSLIFSDEVYKVSKEHSDYMASGPGRFSHAGFNERCNKLKAKIPNIKSCGEIIANGQKNEDEALNSWLKSPGHKAILEDPKYTHSALAYTKNQSGKFFWIQFFIEVD